MTQNKKLLSLGFFIPLVFWAIMVIGGFMTPGYSHLSNLVSELGMIDAKTQYFFTAGLVIVSILSVFFIFGLYKASKKVGLNTVPILILFSFSLSLIGGGIFPLSSILHSIFDKLMVLFLLSPLIALFGWNEAIIPHVKIASIVVLLLFTLPIVFLILGIIPNILEHYPGARQRIAHLAWSIWFIYLSRSFIKIT